MNKKNALLTLFKSNGVNVRKGKCKIDKMRYKASEHRMWPNVKNVIMQCNYEQFIDGFALKCASKCECVSLCVANVHVQ